MKVKFSNSFRAKMRRIKELPDKQFEKITSVLKFYALNTIKNFHDGIKSMSLGLKPLSDRHIEAKRKQGFSIPEAPLYAAGDDKKDNSYCNMMRIKKLKSTKKNGWAVYPSKKKHWKSKQKLKDLLVGHEYGTIKKRGNTMIRIPARPAYQRAFEKTLRDRSKRETSKVVKRAINEVINKSAEQYQMKVIERWIEGLKKFEKFD